MIGQPATSVWLIAGYALLIVGIAWMFDYMAKRTAKAATDWHHGGFSYHETHDAWLCPQDQWLWPDSFDPKHRVVRYRGKPSICNSCPVKKTCTVAHTGREIAREIDPWPHSEAGRFHRGISCVVAAISILLPLGSTVYLHSWADLLVLVSTVILCTICTVPLVRHFWYTPTNFPPSYLLELTEKGSS